MQHSATAQRIFEFKFYQNSKSKYETDLNRWFKVRKLSHRDYTWILNLRKACIFCITHLKIYAKANIDLYVIAQNWTNLNWNEWSTKFFRILSEQVYSLKKWQIRQWWKDLSSFGSLEKCWFYRIQNNYILIVNKV